MATQNLLEKNTFVSAKTILIAENTEYEIENAYILKSTYIRNLKAKLGENEELRIILPKWVTKYSLEKIIFYLKYGQIPDNNDLNDSGMQRLLWLSDFLRLDDFQHKFIQEKVIPCLTSSNCLLFLNESFKKLKTSEESSDSWYVLFNHSMNIMANNLNWNYQNKKPEFLQINEKILEEIVERSLKQNKNVFSTDQKDIVEILMHSRKKADAFELLETQRAIILGKKYMSSANQPNITWKLSNLGKIIEKETSVFKFGGFFWKLVARMNNDEMKGNQLIFYLKFENLSEGTATNDTRDATNNSLLVNRSQNYSLLGPNNQSMANANSARGVGMMNEGVMTVYFAMKANGTFVHRDIQIKSLNMVKSPAIKLYLLEQYEILQLPATEIEFVVNLNLDYTYSAILNHISKNMESYHTSQNLGLLTKDDLHAILKNLPNVTSPQDFGLSMFSNWISFHKDEKETLDLLRALEWNYISLGLITKLINTQGIKSNFMISQYLEREIAKKMGNDTNIQKNNALRSSFMSDTRPKKESVDFLREPSKTNSSQMLLPRGRLFNQANHNGEVEHPRHLSLQREPLSRNSSLNTSLKTNDMPYVPRLLQNKTMATETSQSPNKIFESRLSSSPKRYMEEPNSDYKTKILSQPHSMAPSLSNLNYLDQKSNMQPLQTPPANLAFQSSSAFNNVLSADGKRIATSTLPASSKGMFMGSNLPEGYISPITSPTSKPNMAGLNNSSSAFFLSNKEVPINSPQESSILKNISLSSSFNTQRRSVERRIATETEEGIGQKSRDMSLNRGRESHSDTAEFKRFGLDQMERTSIEEVRPSYSSLEKSTQEKIAIIRRVLQKEKEFMKNDILSQIDIKNFVSNGRPDIFD